MAIISSIHSEKANLNTATTGGKIDQRREKYGVSIPKREIQVAVIANIIVGLAILDLYREQFNCILVSRESWYENLERESRLTMYSVQPT